MDGEITRIFEEFYSLDYGVYIAEPDRFVYLGLIPEDTNHPHHDHEIYVSRRALKHIIERRKQDLLKRHSNEATIEVIRFLLDSAVEVVLLFDEYLYEKPNKHFYTKDFARQNKPRLRVLIEKANEQLHIKSLHIVKRTKKHHESGDL